MSLDGFRCNGCNQMFYLSDYINGGMAEDMRDHISLCKLKKYG